MYLHDYTSVAAPPNNAVFAAPWRLTSWSLSGCSATSSGGLAARASARRMSNVSAKAPARTACARPVRREVLDSSRHCADARLPFLRFGPSVGTGCAQRAGNFANAGHQGRQHLLQRRAARLMEHGQRGTPASQPAPAGHPRPARDTVVKMRSRRGCPLNRPIPSSWSFLQAGAVYGAPTRYCLRRRPAMS